MKTLHAVLAAALALTAAGARAGTLGFDDLPTTTTQTVEINGLQTEVPVDTVVPDGYGGLNYFNLYYVTGNNPLVLASTGGFASGTASSPNVAYDSFGLGAWLVSADGSAFNFSSASLARVYSAGTETFQGLRGGEVIYSADINLGTSAQTYAFNWSNIDTITFSAPGATSAIDPTPFTTAIDDVKISPVPVPEPDAFVLMGVSLAAMAVVRRRKAAKAA